MYGPTEDSGYNTPYAVTVFFNENSLFELCIAALSERSQPVSVIDGADLNALPYICEHPSPDVVIFAEHCDYTNVYSKFFERGFQRIHVFAYQSTEYSDPRVTTFNLSNMFDGHIKLFNGISALYIMDLIAISQFPDYKPCIGKITCADGNNFTQYLRRTCVSPDQIAVTLISMATSHSGYETATNMIQRNIGMKTERTLMAKHAILTATTGPNTLFINNIFLADEIFAADVPKNVEFIILYSVSTDATPATATTDTSPVNTYHTYVVVKSMHACALEYLGNHCAHVVGTANIARGTLTKNSKLIPFLC